MRDLLFLMMAVTRTWMSDRMRAIRRKSPVEHIGEGEDQPRWLFYLDHLLHPVAVVHHDRDVNRDHGNHAA